MASKNAITGYTGIPGLTSPTGDLTGKKFDTGIPGFDILSNAASQNISDLLSGTESPAITQNMNAQWGVGAGVPGTDFLKGRAIDLYGQRSQARKEQGLQDLLNTLQGYSDTVVARPSDILSQQESAANRAQQASQFGQTLGFEQTQWNKQLELLDQLLKQYGGGSTPAGYGNVGVGANPNPSQYSQYTDFYWPYNTPATGLVGTMYGNNGSPYTGSLNPGLGGTRRMGSL